MGNAEFTGGAVNFGTTAKETRPPCKNRIRRLSVYFLYSVTYWGGPLLLRRGLKNNAIFHFSVISIPDFLLSQLWTETFTDSSITLSEEFCVIFI